MELTLYRQFELKPPKWLLILKRAAQQALNMTFMPFGDHDGMGDSEGQLHATVTTCVYAVYMVVSVLFIGYNSTTTFMISFAFLSMLLFVMNVLVMFGRCREANALTILSVFDLSSASIHALCIPIGLGSAWDGISTILFISFVIGYIRNYNR